jgi:hypothetical protein
VPGLWPCFSEARCFTGGEITLKLIALMPVRNEDWCLGLTARAVLMWCDELHILLHRCTDKSFAICQQIQAEVGDRIDWTTSKDEEWREMAHRQILLEHARRRGATHIASIDADEILTGNLITYQQGNGIWIRETIAQLSPGEILNLSWFAMPGRPDRYLVEGPWAGAFIPVAWKDDPRYHWTAREGYDFHHRHPMVTAGNNFVQFVTHGLTQGGLMHLQFCNRRRLAAKDALYQMTEVLRWPGRKTPQELAEMYAKGVHGSDPEKYACIDVPDSWWAPYADLEPMKDFINEPPWQALECERLWAEHGPEKFAGLDLLGIVGEGK